LVAYRSRWLPWQFLRMVRLWRVPVIEAVVAQAAARILAAVQGLPR